jgi:tetratricopeptide (TPR) repeat protein
LPHSGDIAVATKCLCLPDPETGTATVVDHVRLFPCHPDITWEFRVHEQVLPSLRRRGIHIRWENIVIHHIGYLDAALRARKRDRDLRLLRLAEQDDPDHPFTLFNLGCILQEMGQTAEALGYFQRSLYGSDPGASIVRKLYALLAICHRQRGRPDVALTTIEAGRRYYPEYAELIFQEGITRQALGDREGAIACFEQALTTREGAHFGSVAVGLQGYKARQNLAVLYAEQGRLAEAEAQHRAAVAEQLALKAG